MRISRFLSSRKTCRSSWAPSPRESPLSDMLHFRLNIMGERGSDLSSSQAPFPVFFNISRRMQLSTRHIKHITFKSQQKMLRSSLNPAEIKCRSRAPASLAARLEAALIRERLLGRACLLRRAEPKSNVELKCDDLLDATVASLSAWAECMHASACMQFRARWPHACMQMHACACRCAPCVGVAQTSCTKTAPLYCEPRRGRGR